MKIAICTYDGKDRFGGPFTWLSRILPEFAHVGIESHALIFREHAKRDCTLLPVLKRKGITCSSMPLQSLSQWHDNTEGRVRWLLQELRRHRPDVFITNMVAPAYYAARWVREAGIPTVGLLHSDDDAHHALAETFITGADAWQLSAAAVVSQALEDMLILQKTGPCMVRRIPCMVSVPDAVASPPEGVLRLAYAGRLAETHKRILSVGRAFCRAVREIPNTEAVFYGAGPEEDALRNLIEREAPGLPVRIAGFVEPDRLQKELVHHHVIVLQSDVEGLPVALMEGMACGLVPVCRRIRSGIPELVREGETGLLVDDDGDDFVSAVRRLRDNPAYWQTLSRNARQKVEQEYSTPVVVQKWQNLFGHLYETRGPQRRIRCPRRLCLPDRNPLIEGRNARRLSLSKYVVHQVQRIRRHTGASARKST